MSAWHWYTKARRIPTLIGKDAAGRRIPGGPYTALQAIAALVTPAVTWSTRALWAGHLTGLATMIAVLALSFGVVKLLGKVDFASRNPLLVTSSFLRQTLSPPGGTLAGTALRPVKTRRVRSSVVVGQLPQPSLANTATVPTASAEIVQQPTEPPVPSRGSASTESVGDDRRSAAPPAGGTPSRSAGRLVTTSNGLEPAGRPRRSGLEAFLSSTHTQEEAA